MKCFAHALIEAAQADVGSSDSYGLPGLYCSLAVQTWLRRAATNTDGKPPIQGSASAKATRDQLIAAHVWIPVDELRADTSRIVPGMIAIWHRGAPGAVTGHIGIVEKPLVGQTFGTIEANASPTVSRFQRRLDSDMLLGMGGFVCGAPPDSIEPLRAPRPLGVLVIATLASVAVGVATYRAFR